MIGASAMRAAAGGPASGDQCRWALHFRAQLDQQGAEKPVEVDLDGDWVSTITAVRPGEYDAALELAHAHLKGSAAGNTTANGIEQTERRLARPFWVTYRNDGALLAVHFFKDVSPSDRNLLQMIATEMQLVLPGSSLSGPVWNLLERDGGGSYLAIYNQPDPNTVVKRKLKYVHTDGAAGAPPDGLHVDVDQSELRFSLDADGGITALDASNRVRMGVPLGDAAALTAATETHLSNLRRSRAPELIGSLARALPDVESSPIVTHKPNPEQARAQLDDRLLEGRTTESLLVAAMAKVKGDPALSYRLSALFRRRPGAVPTALALLKKNGPQPRITDAVASAGSPEAIAALGNLAHDRTAPTPVRVDALVALIVAKHPPLQAMRIPAALLDDDDARVASAARITSGALARAGRADHPAEADAIDASLLTRYRKARETDELIDLLAAFGNSVGPSVVPLVEEALHDPRGPVRAAAARGLRLAGGDEVDRLLSATITSDQDSGVRAAAIFASGFRRPLAALIGEALVRAANEDAVEWVRSDAISMLRQNPGASPRTAETLAWVAEHDAKPSVRRLAREALASVSVPR
jgi:hypothetical protein